MWDNLVKRSDKDMAAIKPKERPETGRNEMQAFLGEGTDFKGVLAFEGTVRIDGKLEGEIISNDTLIVGENAVINAEINVGSISISGKISGDIVAKERIDIHAKGEVYGNIQSPVLTIEEGVFFQGNCNMQKPGERQVPFLEGKNFSRPEPLPGEGGNVRQMSDVLNEVEQ